MHSSFINAWSNSPWKINATGPQWVQWTSSAQKQGNHRGGPLLPKTIIVRPLSFLDRDIMDRCTLRSFPLKCTVCLYYMIIYSQLVSRHSPLYTICINPLIRRQWIIPIGIYPSVNGRSLMYAEGIPRVPFWPCGFEGVVTMSVPPYPGAFLSGGASPSVVERCPITKSPIHWRRKLPDSADRGRYVTDHISRCGEG